MKHRFCAAALAAVLLLSAAPLSPAASAAFSDAEGTWAAEVIEKAEGYGLMNGYPDGTFGVGKELTRGEFVAVLCRMFGWDAASPGAPSFSDCPASHWAYSYVETALAHGVMDAGGAFRPEDYISREEMAVMLVRALGYGTLAQSLSGLELPFDDVTDNRGYVAIAYDIGMITGVAGAGGQLKFLPRDSATREEAAAMLVRVYERYTSKLDWLHGFYAFSSYSQIDLTASMDAVSVGWARMEYDPAAGPVLNSSRTNGNDWVRPDDPTPATDYWDARSLPYNLNVYASADDSIPLPDGTTTSTVAAVTGTPEARAQAVAALTAASAAAMALHRGIGRPFPTGRFQVVPTAPMSSSTTLKNSRAMRWVCWRAAPISSAYSTVCRMDKSASVCEISSKIAAGSGRGPPSARSSSNTAAAMISTGWSRVPRETWKEPIRRSRSISCQTSQTRRSTAPKVPSMPGRRTER